MKVYTDGSANWKTGQAGAACYFPETGKVFRISLKNSKTGRAEIHGLLLAIKNAPEKMNLIVYSDSMYVVGAINEGWLKSWLRNDFEGKKNKDLWTKVSRLIKEKDLKLKMVHIKGHTGDEGNEIADYFANYKLNKK